MGLSASCICIQNELIVVIHTGGAYNLFVSKYLQVGAKVRMAMAGILIVGDVIAPSVQHIPTFGSGAGSGGLIDTEGDLESGRATRALSKSLS